MKKRRILLVLTVLTVVATFLGGCYHRGFRSDDFPKRMLEHIDEHVEDLQLTADQNAKYLDIRARLEADLKKQKESQQAFRSDLLTTIDQQDASVNDITSKLRIKVNDIPAMANKYLDYIDEFNGILDTQQKALVMEEIRDRADHWRR